MKLKCKIVIATICFSFVLFGFAIDSKKSIDPERDKLLLELLTNVIKQVHYNPILIDDNFSKGMFNDYINALDPSKRFFLQSDIDEFSKFELQLDEELTNKDLTFFYLTYDRLLLRMEECKKFYNEILDKPFDYKTDENFDTNFENAPYSKNSKELKERWRKQIKLSTLSSFIDKKQIEKENQLKDSKYVIKKDNILELETREQTLKSLTDSFGFMNELKREDWFTVYINSIMEQFDPHTSYFAPDDKERFDVGISGTLQGIGAVLIKKNDYIEISELISGGPAWKDKQLDKGDLILKVSQGSGLAVDVVGMRLSEVVKKIKGPKGSEVRLTVKKTDGTVEVISIIRDIVEIEETYVKSSVVEKQGLKYGVIYLPKFYIDFGNKGGRDSGKDIALEIDRLKKIDVDGIVLDLRNDGGGSLSAVVNIAGLFIDKGPIVQVKSGMNKKVLYDTDEKIKWDGPLVIMVNEFSASASEILAAAIQDYKRGIIMGSKQTYGKGTVQKVIDLNPLVKNNSYNDLGALKITIQKFYRINGGSTQLEGVSSDIVMPDRYSYLKMGERDKKHALQWDKIEATPYTLWNINSQFNQAINNSKKRIENNMQFQLIEENAKWIDSRKLEKNYSLNIDKFKIAQNKIDDVAKKFKSISEYKNNLIFNSLPYELEAFIKDTVLKDKRDRWHESLSKDIYVEEALNVLDDLQMKSIVDNTISNNKKGN